MLSFYFTAFSTVKYRPWEAANQALEQVEWGAEKAIEIYGDNAWKGCELIPDVGGTDVGKVSCKIVAFIVRVVIIVIYFAAHTVSTD